MLIPTVHKTNPVYQIAAFFLCRYYYKIIFKLLWFGIVFCYIVKMLWFYFIVHLLSKCKNSTCNSSMWIVFHFVLNQPWSNLYLFVPVITSEVSVTVAQYVWDTEQVRKLYFDQSFCILLLNFLKCAAANCPRPPEKTSTAIRFIKQKDRL